MSAQRMSIPEEVRKWADEVITAFNGKVIRDPDRYFVPRYRGRYLYLDRLRYGKLSQRCRLTYTGDKNKWEFAIYKFSDENYDPHEWFFPGSQHVDGTIEGAMKTGLEAYP